MKHTMKISAIPETLNLLLVAVISIINIFQLFIVPVYLLPVYGTGVSIILLIIYLSLTPLHWALVHEAIHKKLHTDRQVNEILGRVLGILLFASFYLLQFGHLMHHRFNRTLGHEFYSPVKSSALAAHGRYYSQLCIGLYLFEVAASYMVALLPRKTLIHHYHKHCKDGDGNPLPELEEAGHRFFFNHHRMQKVRIDVIVMTILLLAAIFLYREYLFYFVCLMLGRGFIISFHDNIYHYGTPADNSKAAKELYLPSVLSCCMLNFNYHYTHHKYPALPWKGLSEVHQKEQITYDQTFGKALADQCKGAIAIKNDEDVFVCHIQPISSYHQPYIYEKYYI